jgi:RNA polymerase sigma-70 factor (ECF subfamily)
VDRLRAQRRVTPEADAGVGDTGSPDTLGQLELVLDVHAALSALPANSRDVLDRFFCNDESYASISADLGIAPGTVASRISRALARLRVTLAAPVG